MEKLKKSTSAIISKTIDQIEPYLPFSIKRALSHNFKNSYKEHLQNNVLQFDDETFTKFMELLRYNNVIIVGRSIMYFKLGLSEYNNTLDLFIDIHYLSYFLNGLYVEFVPIKCNFTSQYGTYDDNIMEIVFEFTNSLQKKLTINLYCYSLKESLIRDATINIAFNMTRVDRDFFDIISKKLSIFEICYVIRSDLIISINTASKIITDDYPIINRQPKYTLNHINAKEYDLLLGKNIATQYFEETQVKQNYESRIVQELILHLADIHKFDITESKDKVNKSKYSYIRTRINKVSSLYESTNREDFLTGINIENKININFILNFLSELYSNFFILDNPKMQAESIIKKKDINIYTFEGFKKSYIKIFSPSMAKKMNNYIDEVIKEYILKKYEIKINISKNKIKFEYTPIERSIELTQNEKDYIDQILLFYYKNRIYKYKHDYNFNNLIVEKFNLFDIINKLKETEYTFSSTLIKVSRFIISPMCKNKPVRSIDETQHEKILEGISGINCRDLIFADDIKNIKEYLEADKDNIIFIDDSGKNATGISKSDLDQLVSNYADNWFFDCSKYNNNEHLLTPYIKLPFLPNTYYVKYNDLYSLFDSKQRIFYIFTRKDEKGIIYKTASYKNSPQLRERSMRVAPNYVSSNHCQPEGASSITISEIKTIKTKAIEHTKISLNKSYVISSISSK